MEEDAVTTARGHARAAWLLFSRERNLNAILDRWQTGTAPDGSPRISAQVTGTAAAYALRRFTADYHLVLGASGDQRQTVDFSTPGRTSCVWRKSGVWVELWHSDTPTPAPIPSPTPSRAAVVKSRSGLGARLAFTRRRKETKPA